MNKERYVVVGAHTIKDTETFDYLQIKEGCELLNKQAKQLADAESNLASSKKLTPKQLLALKAVVYGCNTNRKCGDGGIFVVYEDVEKKNFNIKEEIAFVEALKIMFELIEKEEQEVKDESTK